MDMVISLLLSESARHTSPLEVQPVELGGVVPIDRARLAFAQPQIGEGTIEDFDPLRHVRRLEEDRVVAGIDRALRAKGLERGFDIGAKVGLGPVRAGVRWQVRELDPHVWITCEVFDFLAILSNHTLLDAGLAAMIEDHGHAGADPRHPFTDEIHLGVVGIDVEAPAELLEQVHPFDEPRRKGQASGISVELHDAADAAHRRMLVAHLDEHGFDALAPFNRGHWDDRLDAGIALLLAFDELDFLDVLAAAFPEVGVTFEENHRLDIELAAVPSVARIKAIIPMPPLNGASESNPCSSRCAKSILRCAASAASWSSTRIPEA